MVDKSSNFLKLKLKCLPFIDPIFLKSMLKGLILKTLLSLKSFYLILTRSFFVYIFYLRKKLGFKLKPWFFNYYSNQNNFFIIQVQSLQMYIFRIS